MPKNQYNEKQITGRINSRQGISGKATPGAGVTDHNRLYNRDAADQHPIEAITDLRGELDSKLDTKTALPLIQEALQSKAAGLYYDAAKEFAKKAYWYLCSEIDPVTKMGTRDSIISGPYDLGQGGGGGGGVTKVTINLIDWPTTVVVGSTANLSINWSSVIGDPAEPTGPGTIYVAVNNKQVIVKPNQAQGLVTFDIGPYLTSGNNSIKVTVLDAYGTQGVKVSTINAVTLELTSNFNYNLNFTDVINYAYTPWGNVDKRVHFIVDGVETGTQLVKSSGEQQTYRITGLHHGSHTLKVYFTAEIDGEEVTSNELFYDLVYYEVGNTTPIIVSAFDDTEDREQYIPFSIPYRVFIWNKNSADIQLLENDVVVKSLTVNFDPQSWEYESDIPAIYHLQIKCGSTTKNFTVHIIESQIQVLPVQENLALALGAQGRSNSESPEERSTWEYNDIHCTLTNFNWSSNGWVRDGAGNTVLRLSGDARATIPYSPFAADFKNYGKTIELEIATSAVMNYSTPIIECLDKTRTDFFEATPTFVAEDTRDNIFTVSLDQATLIEKGLPIGSIVFNYTTNGWALNGETVNLTEYGITLTKRPITDVESDEYILIGDNIRLDHSLSARGFYVTPQIAELRSQQSSLSTQYKEDEHVRLAFVVEKNTENRIIWMYINGIASGAIRYPADDNFRQLDPDIITLGSNDAVLDIYNIRIYDNSLTSKQIVNNWIADTQNSALKAQRYYRNDNYNDKNEIVIEQLPSDLPYIIWDVNPMPQYKGDKRKGNGRYVDPLDSTRNFTTENVEYNVQGTSSAVYPVKNIRMRPKKSDAWYDDNGDPIKKWPITYPGGIGVDYFTFKVDYASSEGANNVELVRLYNNVAQAANILIPPQIQNAKVRVGIDGFPITAFHQDEEGNISFHTKANFNNDKSNPTVFGFESIWEDEHYLGDESWETTNNSADEAKYKIPVTSENWTKAFESRYPDDGTPDEHVYGTQPGELDRLSAMTTWVASTYRENATGDVIEPVTYTYKDVVAGEDGTYSEKTVTKSFDHDTAEYRMTKFKAELADWFNVDSTIFYYLFTHLFLMVDSRAKNAFPTYYISRAPKDGGDRWFWLPYDMDTAIGINNEGKLVFDYSLEDIDQVNGADVFNGQDSVLWCNLRDMFAGEIGKMYSELRTQRLLSYDTIEQMFEDHQSKWSENIFNEDAKLKYVDPLKAGDNYLEMLQGSKEQQRKWWLYNRFKYFDSKYTAGDAKADMIIFRAYAPAGTVKPDIIITPYADIYATVTYTNGEAGTVSRRAKRNEPIIIPNPLEPSTVMTDQEVHIFSASQLKSVGDLSGFRPDTVKVGNAIKLQDLKVGDGAVGYENPNLKELTLGSNTLLKSLDVRNCTNLEQTVDVSLCINLEEAYFENTKIKGLALPDGGNLKHLHLPGTLTSLTLKNQPLLTDLVLASTENIESLWLENIPSSSIDAYELVSRMKANSAVRLIGINETYDDTDDVVNLQKIEQFYNLLDTMKGINADGEDTEKAQVTGIINLPRISYADRVRLMARYPEVNINATVGIICKVDFKVEASSTDIIVTRLPYAGETVMAPADPTKEPTQAKTYRFNHWEYLEGGEAKIWTTETIINTDLVIYGIYDELDREYTVRFNPLSYVVTVEPRTRQVVFNTTFDAPAVSGIPAHVTLSGWYTAENLEWNFETMKIQSDLTLFAHWTDESKPVVSAVRVNYNTFSFTAHDNLGIAAYAVTRTNETPTDWTDIPDAPVEYSNTYVISASGSYYIWVKDTVGNVVDEPARMVAFDVIVTKAIGSEISIHEDVTEFNAAYALFGTALHVVGTIDSHYENLKLYINNLTSENPVDIMVESNTTIRSTCDPKTYTVSFNMMGQGTQISPAPVIYLHTCPQPAAQYTPGFIIGGWYTESELINRWVFETTPIEGDITLYAKWEEYRAPSEFDIVIPAISLDDPDREARRTVKVNFWQTYPETVKVDWGDGSPLDTHSIGSGAAVSVSHVYEVDDDHSTPYTIKVYGPTGDYAGMYGLGGGFANPIVECYSGWSYNNANYVIAVRFAADLSATSLNSYALRGAQITDLCLTPYITKLVTGMYRECTALTNVVIPDWVTLIDQQAFMSCNGLQAVTISDTVREIDNEAFYGCSQLATVNMNAETSSLTFIGHAAFMGAALTHFRIPKNVIAFCWRPGFMPIHDFEVGDVFSGNTALTTAGPYGATDHLGNPVTVEYPWSDHIIDYFGWNTLEEVTFPADLVSIGKCAFYGARLSGTIDLSSYTLLTEIKDFAFLDDALSPRNSIIEFKLPNSLVTLGKEVFENCRSLNKINIPVNVRNIGRAICYSCWNLTDVIINTTALISGKIELEADAWFKDSNRYCILRVDSSILDHHYSTFGSEWDAYRIEGDELIRLTVVAIDDGE